MQSESENLPFSILSAHSFKIISNCKLVDLPLTKPNWNSDSSEYSDIKSTIEFQIIFSNSLHNACDTNGSVITCQLFIPFL